jgi:hypothetical protein
MHSGSKAQRVRCIRRRPGAGSDYGAMAWLNLTVRGLISIQVIGLSIPADTYNTGLRYSCSFPTKNPLVGD